MAESMTNVSPTFTTPVKSHRFTETEEQPSLPSTRVSTEKRPAKLKIPCDFHLDHKATYLDLKDNSLLCIHCAIDNQHMADPKVVLKSRMEHYRNYVNVLQEQNQFLKELSASYEGLHSKISQDLIIKISDILNPSLENILLPYKKSVDSYLSSSDTIISQIQDVEAEPNSSNFSDLESSIMHHISHFKGLMNELPKYGEVADKFDEVQGSFINTFQESLSKTAQIYQEETKEELPQKHKIPIPKTLRTTPLPQKIFITPQTDTRTLTTVAAVDTDALDVTFSRQVTNLDKYFELLSDFKALNLLHLDFSECTSLNDNDVDALSSSLLQMTRLKIVMINFPKISKIQDFSFDTLMNSLTDLPLESLSLNPPFGITTAGVESIILAIKGMKLLNSLNLDLSQTRALDDFTLDLLTNSLQNLEEMQLLSLNLSDAPNLSENTPLHTFFASLQSNPKLYSLQLVMNNIQVLIPSHIKTFSSSLSNLIELRNLALSFQNTRLIDEPTAKALATALSTLDKLESLNLHFKLSSHITDQHSDIIISSLRDLNKLESLSMSFARSLWIGQGTLDSLSNFLKKATQLKSLSLDFTSCDLVTTQGLEFLMNTLSYLSELTNLSLQFNKCTSMNDSPLKYLATSLRVLLKLENLNLGFSYCRLITSNGIHPLALALKNSMNLMVFALNVKSSVFINDKCMESIACAFKDHVNMKDLSLNVSHCDMIKDWGVQTIATMVKHLPVLERLSLNYSNCFRVGNNGMGVLSQAIKNVKNLDVVDFDFSHCPDITKQCCEAFLWTLKKLGYLKKVRVNFAGCANFTVRDMQEFRGIFKDAEDMQVDLVLGEPIGTKKLNFVFRSSPAVL